MITFAEIRFGIELLPPGRRRTELESWLDRDLRSWFSGGILALDEAILNYWALLMAQRQIKGRPLNILDGLLAATARHHRLVLATRNVKDFQELGIQILNPWEP